MLTIHRAEKMFILKISRNCNIQSVKNFQISEGSEIFDAVNARRNGDFCWIRFLFFRKSVWWIRYFQFFSHISKFLMISILNAFFNV